jgi:hypothetical protein
MCPVLRLLAEHLAAAKVAARLEAVPFNCFGFGLFPPGRVGEPESPRRSPEQEAAARTPRRRNQSQDLGEEFS